MVYQRKGAHTCQVDGPKVTNGDQLSAPRPCPTRDRSAGRAGHSSIRATDWQEWRARRDSNPRPLGPQPNALSAELRAHTMPTGTGRGLAEREGFEPSMQVTPHGGLANRCTRPLCDLSVADGGRHPIMRRTASWRTERAPRRASAKGRRRGELRRGVSAGAARSARSGRPLRPPHSPPGYRQTPARGA